MLNLFSTYILEKQYAVKRLSNSSNGPGFSFILSNLESKDGLTISQDFFVKVVSWSGLFMFHNKELQNF